MQFVRRTLLVTIGAFLPVLLFATAFNFGVLKVVGAPESVKKILSDSGIYNSVVGSALEQAKKTGEAGSEVSLTDASIKKAAEDSFTPQVVKDSTEKVIDGTYNWLDGKSAQPDFNVDLSSVKMTFAEKVGQAAKQRAATLPVCTSVPTTTDPFSATCLPAGVTPTQVGDEAKKDVLAGQGFLKHPTITANSIKSSDGSQSVFEGKLKEAPKRYQTFKKTPFILAALTILAVLAIIFLSTTRRQGIRRVGISMAVVGAFMLLFAWGLNRVVVHTVIPKISLDNKVLQNNVQHLATDLTHSIDQNYWIFGGAYLALGVLAILATIFMGHKNIKEKGTAPNKPRATVSSTATDKPAPRPPQKPKSPPKIQG